MKVKHKFIERLIIEFDESEREKAQKYKGKMGFPVTATGYNPAHPERLIIIAEREYDEITGPVKPYEETI